MNKLIYQIELIERIDQLIRLKSTGNPKKLAEKFNVSESSIYRLIETIKDLGAPVEYSISHQSYIYTDGVDFLFGFFVKELSVEEHKKINGGFKNFKVFLKEIVPLSEFESGATYFSS